MMTAAARSPSGAETFLVPNSSGWELESWGGGVGWRLLAEPYWLLWVGGWVVS
jgi:hypothetical protein